MGFCANHVSDDVILDFIPSGFVNNFPQTFISQAVTFLSIFLVMVHVCAWQQSGCVKIVLMMVILAIKIEGWDIQYWAKQKCDVICSGSPVFYPTFNLQLRYLKYLISLYFSYGVSKTQPGTHQTQNCFVHIGSRWANWGTLVRGSNHFALT